MEQKHKLHELWQENHSFLFSKQKSNSENITGEGGLSIIYD